MEHVITSFAQHLSGMVETMVDQVVAENIETYAAIPRERLTQLVTAAVEAFQHDLQAGAAQHFPGYWQRVAGARARQNGQVGDIFRALVIAEEVMNNVMLAAIGDDLVVRDWWRQRLHELMRRGGEALSVAFITAHEEIIREQAQHIRELSTPLIPMHTGVLILPLVGVIDSYRAGQIMEALLEGISREQASVVIIDITGVPVVDTGVANYLLQAARAAQLLGSRIILVGISPEVAQTIVQIGVDLSNMGTRANLQVGVAHALNMLGLEIRPIVRRAASAA
jgi:rsbT co-antagonist protein RsbR